MNLNKSIKIPRVCYTDQVVLLLKSLTIFLIRFFQRFTSFFKYKKGLHFLVLLEEERREELLILKKNSKLTKQEHFEASGLSVFILSLGLSLRITLTHLKPENAPNCIIYDHHYCLLFQILALVITVVVFPLSAYLAVLERRFLLPSVPPRGHGFVLLVFWALIFVSENLSFLNLNKEGWWWHLKE